MSSLLKLQVPTPERLVKVSDSEGFAVRGLSPHQLVDLYSRHTGKLAEMFETVMAKAKETGSADMADVEPIVLALMSEAPVIVSEIIVLASGGTPSNIDDFEDALLIAATLPFPVVLDAIVKIAELTFTSEMPPGKFVALVISTATRISGALTTKTAA